MSLLVLVITTANSLVATMVCKEIVNVTKLITTNAEKESNLLRVETTICPSKSEMLNSDLKNVKSLFTLADVR